MDRTTRRMRLRTVLVALSVACCAQAAAASSAQQAFQRLAGLAGKWQGRYPDGRVVGIEYRLIAKGSALVEDWQAGRPGETMTVYHLDGETLVADHYCAQGNVPRLAMDAAGDRLEFRYRDGSNVRVPGAAHQHWLALDLPTPTLPDRLAITSAYIDNDDDAKSGQPVRADPPLRLHRVDAPAGPPGADRVP